MEKHKILKVKKKLYVYFIIIQLKYHIVYNIHKINLLEYLKMVVLNY